MLPDFVKFSPYIVRNIVSYMRLSGLSSTCRKTLQTLALLWSALRQGPGGKPLIRRAVVVAPTTITQNWAAECGANLSLAAVIHPNLHNCSTCGGLEKRLCALCTCRARKWLGTERLKVRLHMASAPASSTFLLVDISSSPAVT